MRNTEVHYLQKNYLNGVTILIKKLTSAMWRWKWLIILYEFLSTTLAEGLIQNILNTVHTLMLMKLFSCIHQRAIILPVEKQMIVI